VGPLLWLSLAGHELAHGVAARAFGGTVSEFGLRWRLPVIFPYCTVDDVHFLPRRWQQVVTAAAGVFANLLFLLPFAVLWLLLPGRAETRPAIAGLLVLGVATAAANLIPLPPLDGYKMIGYGAGFSRLAAGSRGFLVLLVLRAACRGPGVGSYPRRLRWIYGGYGSFVVVAAAVLVTTVVVTGSRRLADRWGDAAGVVPAALLAALLMLWAGGQLAKRKRVAT
jgi:putative peptide zinc metalloprotease protein